MNAWPGQRLFAGARIIVPAGIKEHEYGLDMMPVSNPEIGIDSALESRTILFPWNVVQEHPHGVHPNALGKAQLAVDRRGIECILLPHLELVDRSAWNEITADNPGLPVVPSLGFFSRPAWIGGGDRSRE
jgi:hypothetical protein